MKYSQSSHDPDKYWIETNTGGQHVATYHVKFNQVTLHGGGTLWHVTDLAEIMRCIESITQELELSAELPNNYPDDFAGFADNH